MADFPQSQIMPPTITSMGLYSVGLELKAAGGSLPASGTWPTNNLGIYVPFAIPAPFLVKKVWWANGATASGNVDCGVYSQDGALLCSAGSTAQGTVSVVQSVTLGTAYLLQPGSYYMALASSTTAATFLRSAWGDSTFAQEGGLAQQASSIPLNATQTLASVANTYHPFFGITSSGTI